MKSKLLIPYRAWPFFVPTKRQRNYWDGYRAIELAKKKATYEDRRESERERKKRDNAKHRRKRSEYRIAYYLRHREAELERNRRYRVLNRAKINAAQVVYRASIVQITRLKRMAKRERNGQLAQPQAA